MDYELYHHGVKGMKWGIRRKRDSTPQVNKRVAKVNKKELNFLRNYLTNSAEGRQGVFNASFSKIDKSAYDLAAKRLREGKFTTSAKYVNNLKDNSVDLYIGKYKSPVMKAKIEKDGSFILDFINENDRKNFMDFANYYDKHYGGR